VAFTGEVTRNEEIDPNRRELDVVVDEVWKGEVAATTLLVTPTHDASCGIDPPTGGEELFLATRGPRFSVEDLATDDELVVMACGGRKDATEAVALGEGRPPDRAASAADGDDGGGGDGVPGWVVGLVLVSAATAIGVFVGGPARRRGAA
jgi:hypothetical protein